MVVGRREVYTGFCWGNFKERDNLEDPGLDRRIILKWIFRKWDGGVDWIDTVRNRDGCGAVVNAVMNLRVP
jgi:hypothetical protein